MPRRQLLLDLQHKAYTALWRNRKPLAMCGTAAVGCYGACTVLGRHVVKERKHTFMAPGQQDLFPPPLTMALVDLYQAYTVNGHVPQVFETLLTLCHDLCLLRIGFFLPDAPPAPGCTGFFVSQTEQRIGKILATLEVRHAPRIASERELCSKAIEVVESEVDGIASDVMKSLAEFRLLV